MLRILLFRTQAELSAGLLSKLSRAGYDAIASDVAEVRTVLQHEPDLLLLQTDVRTLDCCGLLAQLKANEATAPVKVILLAEGGPLERSRALDLGADDVLSIPFDTNELLARVRAQLREKVPDDHLRSELMEAKKKELEAEAALAALASEKGSGRNLWIALALAAATAVIVISVAIRSAQVSNRSNAKLSMQVESLRSGLLTQGQILEQAQKSREALNQQIAGSVNHQLEELKTQSADLGNRISTSSGASLADLDNRLKETDSRIEKLES